MQLSLRDCASIPARKWDCALPLYNPNFLEANLWIFLTQVPSQVHCWWRTPVRQSFASGWQFESFCSVGNLSEVFAPERLPDVVTILLTRTINNREHLYIFDGLLLLICIRQLLTPMPFFCPSNHFRYVIGFNFLRRVSVWCCPCRRFSLLSMRTLYFSLLHLRWLSAISAQF